MATQASNGLRHVSWELFVLALSAFSLLNLLLFLLPVRADTDNVVLIVDGTLCIVFLAHFVHRLHRADSKRAYLNSGGGWLDLVGSLPFPPFRLARSVRVWQAIAQIRSHGGRRLWGDLVRERAQGALYVVLLLVAVVLEFASIGVLAVERGAPDANIQTASDALWWGYVTITTVGYGDVYPVTNEGRAFGIALMSIGVGLFGTFTAFVANLFLSPRRSGRQEQPALEHVSALLEDHERTAARLRAALDELDHGKDAGAIHPAPC